MLIILCVQMVVKGLDGRILCHPRHLVCNVASPTTWVSQNTTRLDGILEFTIQIENATGIACLGRCCAFSIAGTHESAGVLQLVYSMLICETERKWP